MKYVTNVENNNSNKDNNVKHKKLHFGILRASIMSFLAFTLICGLFYTVAVTVTAQSLFPYEANGSIIEVTLKDGSKRIVGSELVGQSYILYDNNGNPVLKDNDNNYYLFSNDEYILDNNKDLTINENESTKLDKNTPTMTIYQGKYLIGRNNSGAPSNASPNANSYLETIEKRKKALESIGYTSEYNPSGIPSELLTESGSGVDPEVSYDAAMYQVKMIAKVRNISEDVVVNYINKYTKNRFLGIFGTKRVNVLMVNLALDGLL